MKTILHVTATLLNGGTEKVILSIAKENKRLNAFNMVLFVFGEIDSKQKEIFESYSVNIIRSEIPFSTSLSYLNYFQNFLKDNQFDGIHCHINLSSSLFIYAAYKQNVPIRISHAHSFVLKEEITFRTRLIISIQRLIIKRYSTNLLAPTAAAGEYMFGSFFKNHGNILPNTIDINLLKNINLNEIKEIKNKYDLNDHIVLGCVGRFDKNKNQTQLIQCFNFLHKKNGLYKLLFIGNDAGTLHECESLIRQYKLTEVIDIIKNVNNIQDYYQVMDVLIIPSLSEGFSLIGLEAQVTNTKVLANSKIPNDIDLNLGLLKFVDITDFEKVYSKLNELLTTASPTNESISNKLNQTDFLPEKMFELLLKIYKCEQVK